MFAAAAMVDGENGHTPDHDAFRPASTSPARSTDAATAVAPLPAVDNTVHSFQAGAGACGRSSTAARKPGSKKVVSRPAVLASSAEDMNVPDMVGGPVAVPCRMDVDVDVDVCESLRQPHTHRDACQALPPEVTSRADQVRPWMKLDLTAEFRRQGAIGAGWRIVPANASYELSPTVCELCDACCWRGSHFSSPAFRVRVSTRLKCVCRRQSPTPTSKAPPSFAGEAGFRRCRGTTQCPKPSFAGAAKCV